MEIGLKEALELFKAGGVHSLKVIAADIKRKTGGEILIFEKAKYALTETPRGGGGGIAAGNTGRKKYTGKINIWDGKNGRIVAIHPRLIVEFDGKEIIW